MKVLCVLFSFLAALVGGQVERRSENVRYVPVLMYHSVCKTNVGTYVCHPDTLRADMAYLKRKGYTAVFVRDLVAFCEGKGDLPQKCVVLSFDDGFYNNAYYVEKIAAEYKMKITVSVVGSYVEKETREKKKKSPVYSYLTVGDVRRMHKGGRVEFANHTYDMHHPSSPRRGIRKKQGETPTDYARMLTEDSEKCRRLLKEKCGVSVNVFTYPFGYYSAASADILENLGYKAILTCEEGINRFRKGSRKGLNSIMRYNRAGKTGTETFFKKIGVV